jgi:hypothetical protein
MPARDREDAVVATGPPRNADGHERLARFLWDRLADDTSAALARDGDGAVNVGDTAGPDADRQFREIATKRCLIQLCLDAARRQGVGDPVADVSLADAVIRELVTVYADHPAYDYSWSLLDGLDLAGPASGPGTAQTVDTRRADQSQNVIPFRSGGGRARRRG